MIWLWSWFNSPWFIFKNIMIIYILFYFPFFDISIDVWSSYSITNPTSWLLTLFLLLLSSFFFLQLQLPKWASLRRPFVLGLMVGACLRAWATTTVLSLLAPLSLSTCTQRTSIKSERSSTCSSFVLKRSAFSFIFFAMFLLCHLLMLNHL